METPRVAFRRIALARHKNYVILLSCLLGMAMVYLVIWLKTLGARFPNFALLVAAGFVIGPLAGVLFTYLFSVLVHRVGRLLGGPDRTETCVQQWCTHRYRSSIRSCFVFPIEIAVFGPYFFSDNPLRWSSTRWPI